MVISRSELLDHLRLDSRSEYPSIVLQALDFIRLESPDTDERVHASIDYGTLLEDKDPVSAFQSIADVYRLPRGQKRIKANWSASPWDKK